jgi:hypothetical protein
VTIVLIILNHVSFGKQPYVLIFHCDSDNEGEILKCIREMTKHSRVKSRNYTSKGMDYVIEFSSKTPDEITKQLRKLGIEKFSIIEYDNEDVI